MRKKKLVVMVLVASLALSGIGQIPVVQAKTVKSSMKLNTTSKSVTVGKKVAVKATVVTVKNEKAGNVKWTVSKKGYITIKSSNKGKKLTIKGVKKGTVTVCAKVKIGKKSFSKKCKIKVEAKKVTPKVTKKPTAKPKTAKKATATPKVTKKPTATPKVTKKPTATPKVTKKPTATPKVTKKPTATPKITKVPTETPEITKEPTPVPTATPEVTKEPTPIPTKTPEVTSEPTSIPTEVPIFSEEPAPIVSIEPSVVTGTTVTTEGAVEGTTGTAIDVTTGSAIDTTTGASVTSSPEEVQKTLKEWRKINDSKYISTQGFCTDGTDFYVAKQSSTQEIAIYRYSDKETAPELFVSRAHALGHANDMTCGNGLIYVATGGGSSDTDQATYGVIAFDIDGNVVGRYMFYTADGTEIKPAGIEYDSDRDIFYVKKGATVYVAQLDEDASELNAISSFKLNYDACTGWTYQGVSYYKNTLYVPVWNKNKEHRESAILEYTVSDKVKANGTTKVSIEKKPSRITYYRYSDSKEILFEIEGITFLNGMPYYVTNGAITTTKQSDRICYFDFF